MKKHNKTAHKNIKKHNSKSKKIFIILSICIAILLLVTFILNFPFSRLRTPKIRPALQNPHIEATLQNEPAQNIRFVLDQQIQSTGCNSALAIKPGTTSNIILESGGIKRSFLLYLPPSYSNSNSHALIMSFHGYASNDLAQERNSQFNQIADNNNVIIVYPQGTTGVLAARGWNTGHHPTLNANDVLFVSNLLNKLQSNLCIDQNQIYASGFSNGGGFVGELACTLSNRIAAFAPISGSYVTAFASCATSRPIPILEFHGTSDKINPYSGISTIKEFSTQFWLSTWAKKDECSSKPTITQELNNIIKYTWNSCRGNASIVHYKIIGEGHTIPRARFELITNGKLQYVNNANIIWNFFQQHHLN